MADLLGFVTGCRKNLHAERYCLRCHFYKRIQRSTFVVVLFENKSNRLLGYLVTASKEYEDEEEEEEEDEENKNGRFRSSFLGFRNAFACLQGQFTVWVFDI